MTDATSFAQAIAFTLLIILTLTFIFWMIYMVISIVEALQERRFRREYRLHAEEKPAKRLRS